MAWQLLHRLTLSHIVALMLICAAEAAGEIFQDQPTDVSAILGDRVVFQCRVNQAVLKQVPSQVAIWYRIKTTSGEAEEIKQGEEQRFFIGGSSTNGVYDLVINHTTLSDSDTSYICSFNQTASRTAFLNLLPESWKPTCHINPSTAVKVGEEVQIICRSDGDSRTDLLWQQNGVILEKAETSVNGKAVSLVYSETFTNNDMKYESLTFTCIAMITGLSRSETCTIGPIEVLGNLSKSGAYIPYVIVGLLSVVVSMLFLTLLVVLFRHRRCRMCRREPPSPQTVLDMAALQNGPPLFYPIHHDSDDGTDDGIGRSPPPDVIPTVPAPVVTNKRKTKSKSVVDRSANSRRPQQQQRREGAVVTRSKTTRDRAPQKRQVAGPPLRRTSSNTTLQGNIDDRTKDKTVSGKKKLTMTNFVKSSGSKTNSQKQQPRSNRQQQQPRNSKQQPRNSKHQRGKQKSQKSRQSQYQVQPNDTRTNANQTEDDARSLKQLNIDAATTAGASSSGNDTSGQSNLADISIDTNDISVDFADEPAPSLNNLDNDLSNRDISPDDPGVNTAVISGASQASSAPSTSSGATRNDKVIYAELDFKKPVGLNIMPDV